MELDNYVVQLENTIMQLLECFDYSGVHPTFEGIDGEVVEVPEEVEILLEDAYELMVAVSDEEEL